MAETELRDYQVEAIDALREGLRQGHEHQVVCAPTGAGKTVLAMDLMRSVIEKGRRALFIVDRLVLVDQTSGVLAKAGIMHGVFQASRSLNIRAPILIASSQTLERMPMDRLQEFLRQFDLVIIDECFPGDVEILTEHGFVRFDEYRLGTSVATWREDGCIEFEVPSKFIFRPYAGKMMRLYSDLRIDLRLTPMHQLVVRGRGGYKRQAAMDVGLNGWNRVPVAGRGVGPCNTVSAEERIVIAAKRVSHRPKKGGVTLAFGLVKEEKVARLLELCRLAGKPVSETAETHGRNFFVYRMPVPTVSLCHWFGLSQMGQERARAILREAAFWGYNNPDKPIYGSWDEEVIDFYQAVAVLAGYRSTKSVSPDSRGDGYLDTHKLFLTVGKVKSNDTIGLARIQRTTEDYIGQVYCVQVSSGAIVVRSNGKVAVVGNCHIMRRKVTDALMALKGD